MIKEKKMWTNGDIYLLCWQCFQNSAILSYYHVHVYKPLPHTDPKNWDNTLAEELKTVKRGFCWSRLENLQLIKSQKLHVVTLSSHFGPADVLLLRHFAKTSGSCSTTWPKIALNQARILQLRHNHPTASILLTHRNSCVGSQEVPKMQGCLKFPVPASSC